MDNENTSIHEFDFNLICEYFAKNSYVVLYQKKDYL
jgi:hypothetical protein